MDFSRGVTAFRDWVFSHTTAYKPVRRTLRGSFAVSGRLVVTVPIGSCRISGADVAQADFEMQVRAFTEEEAAAVSYTTQERDGVTTLLIDGPFTGARNLAAVELELRVPRGVRVDVRSNMGSVKANDVGPIDVRASMGSIGIVNAHADCTAEAQMGSVKVALAPDWNGNGVALNAAMGSATLIVPTQVHLNCSASSSLGSVNVSAGSYPGAPPATVRTSMGSARITSA